MTGKRAWPMTRTTGESSLDVRKARKYEYWERANQTYSHYLSGRTEKEIAEIMEISSRDIKKDISHVESLITSKQLIANNNIRNRILIQREQAEAYQKKLKDALATSVRDYLAAGLNPTTPLKEYREAVGMTEKSGGLNIQVNQNNTSVGGSVSRTEDIIRSVMSKIKKSEKADDNVIDVEPEEVSS